MGAARMVLWCGLALSGCIKPGEVPCGDLICAAGSVCLADGTCASAEAVAACSGLADGTPCQTPSLDGNCIGGACRSPRCGDGIVEGSEQCDGSVTSVDCVDYGFDLGIPDCTERCAYDVITGCTRFGWHTMSSASALSAWTDGNRLAITRFDQGVDLYIGSELIASLGGQYFTVTGNADEIVAWGGDVVFRSTGGAFEPVPTINTTAGITAVLLADDDTMFIVGNPGCEVDKRTPDGQWTVLRSPDGQICMGAGLTAAGPVVAVGPDTSSPETIIRLVAGTWTPLFTVPWLVFAIAERDGVLWVGGQQGLMRWSGGTPTTFGVIGATSVVATATGAYFTYSDGLGRIDNGHGERMRPPIPGLVTADPAGHLYLYGAGGVYLYSGIDFADRNPVPPVTDVSLRPDGELVTANGYTVELWTDFNGSSAFSAPLAVRIVAARQDDEFVSDGVALALCAGLACSTITPTGFTGITDLWARPTGEPSLYAVGAAGLGMVRTGTTWTTLALPPGATGCDLRTVDGNATTVVAVGACGSVGVVWKVVGGAWSEQYRGGAPLDAVAVTDDGEVFASGPNGGVRSASGTWIDEPDATGSSISATTSSDVFVGDGPKGVIHWNGKAWSRLSALGALHARVAASARVVYIANSATPVLLR